MENIEVLQGTIAEVVSINETIKEFDEPYDSKYFEARINGKRNLILVGRIGGKLVGYTVSYEDQRYSESFYVWMAGVDPVYRGHGVLKRMMDYQEAWAKNEGYKKLVLKTRNNRREMLSYLVRYGWNFTQVIPKDNIQNTEILAEKAIV